MKNKNYLNRQMLFILPVFVILATVIGTPHTLGDLILYQKIALNLLIGVALWGFYLIIILWFDQKMPWEDTIHKKRWLWQLGLGIPSGILFELGLNIVRNHILDFPFASHLYLYTDLPIIIILSIIIHYLHFRWYMEGENATREIEKEVKSENLSELDAPKIIPKIETLKIKRGKKNYLIQLSDVAYFFRKDQLNFLRKWDLENFILEESLTKLEADLNQYHFFRLNRKLIIHRKAIQSYKVLPSRQILVELNPALEFSALLNKNRLVEFRTWLEQTEPIEK